MSSTMGVCGARGVRTELGMSCAALRVAVRIKASSGSNALASFTPRPPAATSARPSGVCPWGVGSARLVAPGAGLEGFCWWRDASAVRAGGRGRLAAGRCASGCLRRGRVLWAEILGFVGLLALPTFVRDRARQAPHASVCASQMGGLAFLRSAADSSSASWRNSLHFSRRNANAASILGG